MTDLETDVLVVGSGPAGGSAALFLSTYGVDNMMRHEVPLDGEHAARAHHQPADDGDHARHRASSRPIIDQATPHHLMGDTVFCTSLAGEEIGRAAHLGHAPARRGRLRAREPVAACRPAADLFEPILLARRGRARDAASASTRSTCSSSRTPTA